MNIDDAIKFAHDGTHGAIAAALAREVLRLRGATAVVVPDLDQETQRRICDEWGEGELRAVLRGYDMARTRPRAIPADRVQGEGMVALRRFAERCAQRDHQPDEHIGPAKCVACEAEDALRANQGGAGHD